VRESDKNPAIVDMMSTIGKAVGYALSPREAWATNRCVNCANGATSFKDEISKKEYMLSGLCQTCQDEFFSGRDWI
jgi:hypothetical protein